MFDFAHIMDLPMIWGGIIALAIFLYVLLDGFDLGVGILFPFAPTDQCRDTMMHSIAPFWDGNETWLVLGGGGLLAAFPLAYSILMPAFYIPIILLLFGLIFRGVAFEFRFKSEGRSRQLWDDAFHFGSLIAAFFQGVILGAFVQGVAVEGRMFSGGTFDWLTPFSLMTGVALIFGYALMGSTWLVMKTEGRTAAWARTSALYVLIYVLLFIGIVSLWVPFLNTGIRERWFSVPNIFYLSPIPIFTALTAIVLAKSLTNEKRDVWPFMCAIFLFSLGYIGLAISLWPWIVPYQISLWQAAAHASSQSLLLVGVLLFLPLILGYTAYCYYVFRGKTILL